MHTGALNHGESDQVVPAAASELTCRVKRFTGSGAPWASAIKDCAATQKGLVRDVLRERAGGRLGAGPSESRRRASTSEGMLSQL